MQSFIPIGQHTYARRPYMDTHTPDLAHNFAKYQYSSIKPRVNISLRQPQAILQLNQHYSIGIKTICSLFCSNHKHAKAGHFLEFWS